MTPNEQVSDGWPWRGSRIGKTTPGQPFAQPKSWASSSPLASDNLIDWDKSKPKNSPPQSQPYHRDAGECVPSEKCPGNKKPDCAGGNYQP
jgi:hypothetical protein